MSQAEKIRELATEILTQDKGIQEEIMVNNQKFKGIRYNILKQKLLDWSDYKFTEGGVTGALYTLPDRVDGIFKVKTKKGVFFYFSSKEIQEKIKEDIIITESIEYIELASKVEEVSNAVRNILFNASHEFYKSTNQTDLDYLRKLLRSTSQLEDTLKEYKIEKSFEKIKNQNELPF
ncbi:hypothetical protein [Sporosarcina aquimarina]|uniref:Uncharacterized protein n=1 Tax=Sporosarcina aquimarina TaxID=114975 RepID=A0ABU4G3H9_9BACL|nr:hypothetical protein [Sporosarcina aquimarina]MDW0111519.1 hypothetical protein [Sporosarcina aquimarina]